MLPNLNEILRNFQNSLKFSKADEFFIIQFIFSVHSLEDLLVCRNLHEELEPLLEHVPGREVLEAQVQGLGAVRARHFQADLRHGARGTQPALSK